MPDRKSVDIVLVSCVKSKQAKPCAAGDMYTSPLFKKMMAYAKTLKPRRIFILSAKYGLVDPETVIEPYEQTLNRMSFTERAAWTKTVLDSLRKQADLGNDHMVFLAGARYRDGLVPHIRHCAAPMKKMPFGKQLRWLEAQVS